MTRLTMAVVAALIITLCLAVILVKLLLDLHADEPESSESRQLDRRQDSKQRAVKPGTLRAITYGCIGNRGRQAQTAARYRRD
jgi:hypothetical protein